jgi:hypothetical protein
MTEGPNYEAEADEAFNAAMDEASYEEKNEPIPGVQYRLTGGPDVPSIQRGDTWAASRIKPGEDARFTIIKV